MSAAQGGIAAKLHESEIRRHYTLVCQCDYADDHDFDERIATSSECVMHGDEPDPLFSLLAEYERLRQAEDRLVVAREAFSAGDYEVMEDALRG